MKTEVEVLDCGSIFDALFATTPEDVVRRTNRIIDKAQTAGYDKLHIIWKGYDDQYPSLYGSREETEQERTARTKKQQQDTKRKTEAKERKIQKAKQILTKYGITQ